ncbi:single-stranded DNA-binding protein [Bacillus mobilis]|uniref:single-stranded DNA-binding protein n=1 Tax=Bacillus mobilis TaxID=2026190 RepID=UPI002E237549|nr:single-stranded DNA-binding protein [Bacillus mobilis]
MAERNYYSFVSFRNTEENKAFGAIEGYITKPVELEDTTNGKKVAKVSMVSQNVTKKIGKALKVEVQEKDSEFINITGWEQLGERMSKAVQKGDTVIFTGDLKSREYNGNKYFDLTAWDFTIKRKGKGNQSSNEEPSDKNIGQPIEIADDDLPF